MSLFAFHKVFVISAIVFSGFVGALALRSGFLISGGACWGMGVVLVPYLIRLLRSGAPA